MNPQDSQLLTLQRHCILIQLEHAYPASLPTSTLHTGLYTAGHPLSPSSLDKHIHYLLDKNIITSSPSPINPNHHRYKITPSGIDYLQDQNLA